MIHVRIHPSTLLLFALPLCGLLSPAQTAILWLSALLHEAGHIIAYRLCGGKFSTVTVLPFGISAQPKEPWKTSAKTEIICAAWGPAINFILCAFLFAIPFFWATSHLFYALYCNLCLLVINLLPILPLDGGRMLFYALARKFDLSICETVCRRVGWIFLCLLLYPVCYTLFVDKNPSLAIIWGYLTLYNYIQRGSI